MSATTEFAAGVGLLGRGLGLMVRRPRLFWLGALPPLITSILFVIIVVLIATNLTDIAGWLTPFADGWSPGTAEVIRVLVAIGFLTGSILLMVLSFTTLTLALGSPLYDKISEYVDEEFIDPPEPLDEPVRVSAVRAVRQSVALIVVGAIGAVVFLLVGLIPVAGSIVAAVGSAVFGGWMIGTELVGSPLERRGVLTLAGRRTAMRTRRARSLGLGVPTFLLLSLPFVGIVAFPVAMAAGTILARQLSGEETTAAVVTDR
ncbi:MAG TPA: EI24 domain-containing protein [Propionibacteriaceae bacterium]